MFKISEELKEKIKIYKEKRLGLRKEIDNLIKEFNKSNKELKNIKIIEISNKFYNEVNKKQKELYDDIDKIQNEISKVFEEIRKAQYEILTYELINKFTNIQNESEIKINKIKDMDKFYNDITEVIIEESNFIKELETFNNSSINETELKILIEKFKVFENCHKKIGEKINVFQKVFIPKANIFKECMKENDNCKKEIMDIFNKFKEKNLETNESLDKLLLKMKELSEESKNLKIIEIINKNKNEMKPNWEKIELIYNEITNKIQTIIDKKKEVTSKENNIINSNNNIKKEKPNEIIKKDKENEKNINEEMKILKEKQNELMKIIDNLKENKKEYLNEMNLISEEQDKSLEEIKVVYKNDIKNINIQNIKDNYEKYKIFNEKYKNIIGKIKKISDKCTNLAISYNGFVEKELLNRKKIFENIKTLSENGFYVDENIIKRTEEIVEKLKNFKLNELNEIFKGTINLKMKNLNEVKDILVNLTKKNN